jgi:hypothetical protein
LIAAHARLYPPQTYRSSFDDEEEEEEGEDVRMTLARGVQGGMQKVWGLASYIVGTEPPLLPPPPLTQEDML